MKLSGACCLAAICVIIGFSISKKLSTRVKYLECILRFLKFTESQIQYSGDPFEKVFLKASQMSEFKNVDFITDIDFLPAQNPYTQIKTNSEKHSGIFSSDDLALIGSFADSLGTLGRYGETEQLKLYISLFGQQHEKATNEYLQKGKMVRTLGVLAGIAVIIIFL